MNYTMGGAKCQVSSAKCGLTYFTGKSGDKTKGGGRSGVQREHRGSVPESERSDLKKIQLSSKLGPKEFVKKICEWMGTARRNERPVHHNTKGNSTERPYVSPHTHREA